MAGFLFLALSSYQLGLAMLGKKGSERGTGDSMVFHRQKVSQTLI